MHTVQKDTTFTKIFVGGLPYHTTDSSLRKYFEVFGDIDEAVVITDRQTGKSRGYGFVSARGGGWSGIARQESFPEVPEPSDWPRNRQTTSNKGSGGACGDITTESPFPAGSCTDDLGYNLSSPAVHIWLAPFCTSVPPALWGGGEDS